MAMVRTCSVLMFRPVMHAALFTFLIALPAIADNTGTTKPPPCSRMIMYKRRHYYTSGPSMMPNKRKVLSSGSNLYRKRIAYTELKDMNND